MTNEKHIDFSRLLGFGAIADQPTVRVDLMSETVAARIGVKVGFETVRVETVANVASG